MSNLDEAKILDAFRKNRPYLIDIEQLVQKVKYGLINISIRVHDSKVTDLTVQSFQKVRYELGKDGSMSRQSEEAPLPDLKTDNQK